MSEYDEVLGLKAIRNYRELWESDLIVGFILDAKDEYLIFLSPEDGWHDTTNGAVSEVIRELGGRLHLDDVDTPEDLLEVVNYYKSYTDALSADEGLSKRVNCTEFVSEIYKLYRKIKTKPILGEPRGYYRAREASQELDRYRNRILQIDNSLSAKAEPFESIPADERAYGGKSAEDKNEYTFIKKGDFWTIIFEMKKIEPVKPQRGLVYIQHLLRNSGKNVNAFELSNLINPDAQRPITKLPSDLTTKDREAEGIASDPFGHAGEAIDEKASKEIKECLRGIRKELDEAEENNDAGRVDKLLEKKQEIEMYLSSSTGLGGRPRKLDDISDKVRSAVSKAINRAMTHLEPHSAELAAYLRKNTKKGFECSYKPEQKIDWKT